MKIKRPMSLMVYKQRENHKISIRLTLFMIFCFSFSFVCALLAIINNNEQTAIGYFAISSTVLVGLSVAFAADRAAFSKSVQSFDERAFENIHATSFLFIILNDLLERVGVVREQATKKILRNDVGDYLLFGYERLFEIRIYGTIQGSKFRKICELSPMIYELNKLINIFDGCGTHKSISIDRSELITKTCEEIGARIFDLMKEIEKFRFNIDLGEYYRGGLKSEVRHPHPG